MFIGVLPDCLGSLLLLLLLPFVCLITIEDLSLLELVTLILAAFIVYKYTAQLDVNIILLFERYQLHSTV